MRVLTLAGPTEFKKVKYRTGPKNFKIGPVSMNFITIGVVCILSLFYLIQSQQSSVKYYKIQALQDQKEQIMSQNEDYQIKVSQLKSIANIQNTASSLGMVPAKDINYLNSQNN